MVLFPFAVFSTDRAKSPEELGFPLFVWTNLAPKPAAKETVVKATLIIARIEKIRAFRCRGLELGSLKYKSFVSIFVR